MTCIKTGAVVLIENYGYTVPADIYEIDSCYIIRWNKNGVVWDHENNHTHTVMYWAGDNIWHREDIGVTVLPKIYLHNSEDYRREE